MMVRGVRGAIIVHDNTEEAILTAARKLLHAMIDANDIIEDHVASVFFTTTPDLTATYPARAARDLGWHSTALIGCVEIDVPSGMAHCLRILIHWNTTKSLTEIQHVYMEGALQLRPDLYPDNKLILDDETA